MPCAWPNLAFIGLGISPRKSHIAVHLLPCFTPVVISPLPIFTHTGTCVVYIHPFYVHLTSSCSSIHVQPRGGGSKTGEGGTQKGGGHADPICCVVSVSCTRPNRGTLQFDPRQRRTHIFDAAVCGTSPLPRSAECGAFTRGHGLQAGTFSRGSGWLAHYPLFPCGAVWVWGGSGGKVGRISPPRICKTCKIFHGLLL